MCRWYSYWSWKYFKNNIFTVTTIFRRTTETTIPVLRLEYSGRTRSIHWMAMPWLLALLGHRYPWHWLLLINGYLSSIQKDTCTILVSINDRKWNYICMALKINSPHKGLIHPGKVRFYHANLKLHPSRAHPHWLWIHDSATCFITNQSHGIGPAFFRCWGYIDFLGSFSSFFNSRRCCLQSFNRSRLSSQRKNPTVFNFLAKWYMIVKNISNKICIWFCCTFPRGKGVNTLTHCGLVTPYGNTELGQHWLR